MRYSAASSDNKRNMAIRNVPRPKPIKAYVQVMRAITSL
jgi:hypothetical protein